jgi:hypothetical protein
MFARLAWSEVILQRFGRILWWVPAVLVEGIGGCLLPTDRSDELQVQMEILPDLFVKDTVELRARLVDGSGTTIPNAVISYGSDDLAVVTVTGDNRLLAVGVGAATVTATAVGYDETDPATRTAQVRGLLEVDSIRNTNTDRAPGTARFGDLLEIFGVGLSPDSLFAVTIGGTEAEILDWIPNDQSEPNRLGRLFVWVPPPAPRQSQMFFVGFNGGLLVPDTLNIVQRDVYEFNDTIPAALGPIPLGFRNPALAFEARVRTETEVAVDWYTFTNPDVRDRTLAVFSQMVGAETFVTLVTDSIFWDGGKFDFEFGSSAWTIGRETYRCDGLQLTASGSGEPVTFAEVPFPLTIVSLADLPVGTYHVFVPFVPQGGAASYEVLVLPGYVTLGGVGRDSEEENDYCDAAGPLPTGNAPLTIDNPHDVDWYRFSVMYLIRDFRPDSLVLVLGATTAGDVDEVIENRLLPAGGYFLVVFDFTGVPTGYTLSSALTAPPVGAAPAAAASAGSADVERIRAKHQAAKQLRPPSVVFPEALRTWRP